MARMMVHCNGNMICAIDTETTGLDPRYNEIWQICILPLDSDLKPNKDHHPFYLMMKPSRPEYINWEIPIFKRNKKKILDAINRGHDPEKAHDLLGEWIEKLELPTTKWGTPKKIMPLGQNYAFDKAFIQQWLGMEQYEEWFDYHDRDTMVLANFFNDYAAFRGNPAPFAKVNLPWLCKQFNIVNSRAHDALSDCVATADVYRNFCKKHISQF